MTSTLSETDVAALVHFCVFHCQLGTSFQTPLAYVSYRQCIMRTFFFIDQESFMFVKNNVTTFNIPCNVVLISTIIFISYMFTLFCFALVYIIFCFTFLVCGVNRPNFM